MNMLRRALHLPEKPEEKINYKELFEDLLYIIEKSLQIIGLSDVYRKRPTGSNCYLFFQKCLYYAGTFQMPFLMIGEVILIDDIFRNGKITNENYLKLAEVSPCLIICSFCLIKSSRLIIQKDNLVRIVDQFREMWPGNMELDDETKKIVDKHMLLTKKISITYSLVTHILSAVYNLFPVGVMLYNKATIGQTDYILPYLVWYPYDTSKNFLIWLSSYISHFYAGIFTTGSVAAADCFFGLISSLLSMHIELLSKRIEKLATKGPNGETPRENLTKIIKDHNKLIEMCATVETIFSPIMLFNLVASSIMLCILLFSVTIAPPGLMAKYTVFIASAMTQILMMSWYGSKVITTSNKLGVAAYSCAWTSLTDRDAAHIKKSLVMLMARAKKPLCITAYGFTVISMKTFSMIIRASWSYFTLLRVMYKKSS